MLLTQAARSGRKRKTIMKQRVSRLSTGSLEHGNLLGFVAIAATSYCSMENTSLGPWKKEGDWVGVVVGRGRGSQKDLGISAVSGICAGMDSPSAVVGEGVLLSHWPSTREHKTLKKHSNKQI